ncbi:MAG: acylneuraminate cytidylyltransferase family protein [Myxococcaceae bacterium]|nr:acylneuraminate cytidylyltransferase family protein [Myxococcaceae bacterium]
MRVLGIVPARAGSKRVPRKNVRPLGGKPLIAHALEAALAAKSLARVVVSSDSDEVLAVAAAHPGAVALRRPDALAQDTSPAIDYVKHALASLEGQGEARFDAVAIVQATSPFTTAQDIDDTVGLLERSPEADSAVSVMEVDHATHPVKLKRMEGVALLPYLEDEGGRMAAHELPRLFVRNCSVYVTRRPVIDAQGSVLGKTSVGLVMPRERSLDINDELDFAFAEFLVSRRSPR